MVKGQVLIIVLLVIAVLVTVGLSVVSRSVTEMSISTTQDEASRALQAAEIGLEKQLGGVFESVTDKKGDIPEMKASFVITSEADIGGTQTYRYPRDLQPGEIATLDFNRHPTVLNGPVSYVGTSLRVCWGRPGYTYAANTKPAIEVMFYYRKGANTQVSRRLFDPETRGRSPAYDADYENATGGTNDCGTGTPDFPFSVNLMLNAFPGVGAGGYTPYFLRVRLLYPTNAAEPLAFLGTANFPLQAGTIESLGQSGDAVQKIRAKVTVYDLPPMFDEAVFSGGSLIHN